MAFPFVVSTDRARLDLDVVHGYLSASYWAKGIPRQLVQRSIENSLCFGGYLREQQVAFARVISDYATFAYLGDVFVLEHAQGQGYGKQLMRAVFDHPQLQGLRRFMLATASAHRLYAGFDFGPVAKPESLMERYFPTIYQTDADG